MAEKIRLREKVGYGLGDFASSMFWKVFSIYLAIFYTDVFGISAAAVGTMLLVSRIWDTANDPIMGIICDRTKTKWGKFRPYLLWIAVPFGIMGVLLFTTPDLGSTGKLVYAYITYTLMMMVYTAINVPYASLLGVMTYDSGQRTAFASYRMAFAFGGSLFIVAVYQPLIDYFHRSFTLERSYQLTMLIVGLLALVFFILTFSLVRERIVPPKEQKNSLRNDFKNLLANVPWFILLASGIATLLFNSIRDGVSLYYFKYYIMDDVAMKISAMTFTYSTAFLFLGQASNMCGVILAKTISNFLGKRLTYMYAMFLAALFSFIFALCDRENLVMIYILQALISFCAGIIFPLLWSMYADTADYSQWKTGRRATGLIFSASSMSQKIGWTIGGSISLWLLSYYGFKPNVDQSPATIQGIRNMMSFVPGIFALVSGMVMVFYKLSDKKMNEIMKELARNKHANAI